MMNVRKWVDDRIFSDFMEKQDLEFEMKFPLTGFGEIIDPKGIKIPSHINLLNHDRNKTVAKVEKVEVVGGDLIATIRVPQEDAHLFHFFSFNPNNVVQNEDGTRTIKDCKLLSTSVGYKL